MIRIDVRRLHARAVYWDWPTGLWGIAGYDVDRNYYPPELPKRRIVWL